MILLACAPHAPPSAWDDVRFDDPGLATVVSQLRASSLALRGWEHEALALSGSGALEMWCAGYTGHAGCWGHPTERGVGWRTLSVDQPPGGEPVSALSWEAGWYPPEGTWGAVVSLDLAPGGDDFRIDLARFAGSGITDRIRLGRTLELEVEQTEIQVPPGSLPARQELERALASPEAFADWGRDAIARLEVATKAAFAEGTIEKCGYGRYHGDGSPACVKVPVPAAEAASLERQVLQELARASEHLGADAQEIHALVVSLLPVR